MCIHITYTNLCGCSFCRCVSCAAYREGSRSCVIRREDHELPERCSLCRYESEFEREDESPSRILPDVQSERHEASSREELRTAWRTSHPVENRVRWSDEEDLDLFRRIDDRLQRMRAETQMMQEETRLLMQEHEILTGSDVQEEQQRLTSIREQLRGLRESREQMYAQEEAPPSGSNEEHPPTPMESLDMVLDWYAVDRPSSLHDSGRMREPFFQTTHPGRPRYGSPPPYVTEREVEESSVAGLNLSGESITIPRIGREEMQEEHIADPIPSPPRSATPIVPISSQNRVRSWRDEEGGSNERLRRIMEVQENLQRRLREIREDEIEGEEREYYT